MQRFSFFNASSRKLSFMSFNLAAEYSRAELIQRDFQFYVVENLENILMFMQKKNLSFCV